MTLLVCIATQQESTNLIPALELNPRAVLSLATAYAIQQRWRDHLAAALRAIPLIPAPLAPS